MPHGPWLYTPDGRLRAVSNPRAPGRSARALVELRPRAPGVAAAPDCRSATRTRCSAGSSTGCKAVGLWDKALVVVDPDHGISFRGGDKRRQPTATNLVGPRVHPALHEAPGQRTRADRGHARHDGGHPADDRRRPRHRRPVADDRALGARATRRRIIRSCRSASSRCPYAKALAQRRRSLARQLALFGTGAWDWRFAGTGRFRTLVGKPVETLNVVEKLDNHAVVDKVGSKLLRSTCRRGKPLVPSPLAGYLPHLRRGGWIALALNGRIAAVSHTYGTGGKLRFSLLAGDSAFRVGQQRRADVRRLGRDREAPAARVERHAVVVAVRHRSRHRRRAGARARRARGMLRRSRTGPKASTESSRCSRSGRRRAARPRRAAASHRRELRRRRRQRRSRRGARARRARREHAGRAHRRRLRSSRSR